jgi:sugar lactone lactonase YvrE
MLYFVDIPAPALYRLDPRTKRLDRFEMPGTIGSFGLTSDGRAIVALRHGVHLFDMRTGNPNGGNNIPTTKPSPKVAKIDLVGFART